MPKILHFKIFIKLSSNGPTSFENVKKLLLDALLTKISSKPTVSVFGFTSVFIVNPSMVPPSSDAKKEQVSSVPENKEAFQNCFKPILNSISLTMESAVSTLMNDPSFEANLKNNANTLKFFQGLVGIMRRRIGLSSTGALDYDLLIENVVEDLENLHKNKKFFSLDKYPRVITESHVTKSVIDTKNFDAVYVNCAASDIKVHEPLPKENSKKKKDDGVPPAAVATDTNLSEDNNIPDSIGYALQDKLKDNE